MNDETAGFGCQADDGTHLRIRAYAAETVDLHFRCIELGKRGAHHTLGSLSGGIGYDIHMKHRAPPSTLMMGISSIGRQLVT